MRISKVTQRIPLQAAAAVLYSPLRDVYYRHLPHAGRKWDKGEQEVWGRPEVALSHSISSASLYKEPRWERISSTIRLRTAKRKNRQDETVLGRSRVDADAQDEPTLEQHFAKFQTQVKEIADDLAEKTKTAFQNIEQSEFGTKTRNWFNEQYAKLKQKMSEGFN
ncbi:hypothetical protein DNTS_014251 [Danionella cerebrum]|uniref:Uncharacterized protein n=1 Tax=Danionella cerebrum TaxID=2873325 RepID=A0A553QTW6_9TELE|nr:hypothetical protein DNTS_014251 [Danionella translucida]